MVFNIKVKFMIYDKSVKFFDIVEYLMLLRIVYRIYFVLKKYKKKIF